MKRCLIVVDCQNDFVNGSLGFDKAITVIPIIADKIKQYRNTNDDIIFTCDTHYENYINTQEGKNLPFIHCIKGTKGQRLCPEIDNIRLKSDKYFEKSTFGSDKLFDYLRENQYSNIELCGLVSNICVLSNAVLCKTAQPETPISVDIRCTASFDEELNQAALMIMNGIQIKLTGWEEQ